jgi:uncharacterized membrane protein
VETLVGTSTFERFVIWAPAIVIGFGLVGAVMILLGRAFADTVRESEHPRWILGGLVALCGVVVLLTWLGISLPKE